MKVQFSLRTAVVIVMSLGAVGYVGFMAAWYFDWGHGATEKIPELVGKLDSDVIAKYGTEYSESKFRMDHPLGEFHVGLLNFYPPGNPSNANVEIRELTWSHIPYNVTIWFHKVNDQWQ